MFCLEQGRVTWVSARIVWRSLVDYTRRRASLHRRFCHASSLPLLLYRRVETLWLNSAVSVALAIVFVGICTGMVIAALIGGQTQTPRLFPELNRCVSLFNLFTAIPIIVTAFTFHFNGSFLEVSELLRELKCGIGCVESHLTFLRYLTDAGQHLLACKHFQWIPDESPQLMSSIQPELNAASLPSS